MPRGSTGIGRRNNQRARRLAQTTVSLQQLHNPPKLERSSFVYRSHCATACGTRDCTWFCTYTREIEEFICDFYILDGTGTIVELWRETDNIRLQTANFKLLWRSPAYRPLYPSYQPTYPGQSQKNIPEPPSGGRRSPELFEERKN